MSLLPGVDGGVHLSQERVRPDPHGCGLPAAVRFRAPHSQWQYCVSVGVVLFEVREVGEVGMLDQTTPHILVCKKTGHRLAVSCPIGG